MNTSAYVDDIKLKLTGGILELEIDDGTITKIINTAFREVQRYINSTVFETIPCTQCIDLSPRKINAVVAIYKTEGDIASSDTHSADPMYIQQWNVLSNVNNMTGMNVYLTNLTSWLSTQQIRNTLSTELDFIYDRPNNKLYINSTNLPSRITVEYIPRFDSVEEIISDYWIDIIMRMSLALTKITLGRIRSRFTQSGALWSQDGETMLNEGNAELQALRDTLSADTELFYPID